MKRSLNNRLNKLSCFLVPIHSICHSYFQWVTLVTKYTINSHRIKYGCRSCSFNNKSCTYVHCKKDRALQNKLWICHTTYVRNIEALCHKQLCITIKKLYYHVYHCKKLSIACIPRQMMCLTTLWELIKL